MAENRFGDPTVPEFVDDDAIDLDDSGIPEHHGIQPLGLSKFAVMFFSTFGLYFFYWHYRTLRSIREHTGEPKHSLGRTLLLFIPVVNLFVFRRLLDQDFERMRERVGGQRFVRNSWVTVLEWAVLYTPIVLLAIMPKSPYWVVGLFAFIPLRPLQLAMNIYLHRLPLRVYDENTYSAGEKALVAIGAIATAFLFGTGMAAFIEKYLSSSSAIT